jgi:uncharacterized protein YdeI (YjbR/CyaY-like superfamily)
MVGTIVGEDTHAQIPRISRGTIPVMGSVHQDGERFVAETAEAWASWPERNHGRAAGVWLVTWRPRSGRPVLDYEAAVVEALRFGWIDSTGRTDEDHREQWFSPRRPGGSWARTNKRRIERLEQEGRMEPAGRRVIEAAKADGSWSLLDGVEDLVVPDDLDRAFQAVPGARGHWDAFPPSARRVILWWIVQARRPATRAARIEETARLAGEDRRAGPVSRAQAPPRTASRSSR